MAATVCGQKTVPTAGTAVQLGAIDVVGPLAIKALDTNTGIVAVGNDGANSVSLANGFRLQKGETLCLEYIGSMASLYLNAGVNGEGVSWHFGNV